MLENYFVDWYCIVGFVESCYNLEPVDLKFVLVGSFDLDNYTEELIVENFIAELYFVAGNYLEQEHLKVFVFLVFWL